MQKPTEITKLLVGLEEEKVMYVDLKYDEAVPALAFHTLYFTNLTMITLKSDADTIIQVDLTGIMTAEDSAYVLEKLTKDESDAEMKLVPVDEKLRSIRLRKAILEETMRMRGYKVRKC